MSRGQFIHEIIAERKLREKLARMETQVGSQPEWDYSPRSASGPRQQVSDEELEAAREKWRKEKKA